MKGKKSHCIGLKIPLEINRLLNSPAVFNITSNPDEANLNLTDQQFVFNFAVVSL